MKMSKHTAAQRGGRTQRPLRRLSLLQSSPSEEGVVAVIVAVALVLLLSVVALVVDLSSLYGHDRELQTAADAGALAGAQELVLSQGDQTAAAGQTEDYVGKNTAPETHVVGANLSVWAPQVDASSVTVNLQENHVAFTFARVFGRNEGTVHAHARAEVKYLSGVGNAFPVAMLLMTPDKFRFVFKSSGGTTVGSFDLTDPNKDGIYDQGGTTLPSVVPGLYTVTLEAVSKIAGEDKVVLTLGNIGLWYVSDPATSTLYKVGMSLSGGTITVQALLKSQAPNPDPATIKGSLGGKNFTLTKQGPGAGGIVYSGNVAAPSPPGNNSGYETSDLVITVPDGKKGTDVLCGRYAAFNPDVPIYSIMMTPSTYAGYSRISGEQTFQSALTSVRTYHVGDTYIMKLSNADKGGPLYSGNWRLADIWSHEPVEDVIAATTPDPDWTLTYPLVIGGPLMAKPGNIATPVYKGLSVRIPDGTPLDDPRRVVIVPICNYEPDLGGRDDYTINGFAAFRITSFEKNGDVQGQFVRWVSNGPWQNDPPGPLYVETAVLTQ